ncbi:hypothetical protein [Citreimonas salinaria]|uniref:Uncharacterized protein n=1 Tax=Citreimonas salinaria TaxID=321339 RepID=A0A1H3J7K2_9RHOB|nr:hypothetical protein [Citreimonas salinaria]SDY35398.1 hypothetical protein SAMN05444340_10677 [Citreimonas salinaria]
MAERRRSKDGSRDTDRVMGEKGTVAQGGREGGELPRKKGTKDEMKRATERPAGATRVRKGDEEEDNNG